ncbi:MAG: amidase [Solirubrobacterales bacterium]|nr:amidase [Solirubrobacterales bacterium]
MEAVLSRIDEVEPEVNAWIHLDRKAALTAAKAADKRKRRPPLFGIPICVKDVIDVAGMPTTAGSANWSRTPMHDAESVARLKKAGAIVVGKGNTNEFAFGIDGRNSHWGDCHNPFDTSRISGGSSSGPAAAVASGMALGGIGTDTSGSIRVPASLCGLVGVRPTLNLVPTDGVFPLAHSYDVIGPLARTATDAEILTSVLSGEPKAKPKPAADPAELRVVVADDLVRRAGKDVAGLVMRVTEELARQGATLAHVAIPGLDAADEVHRQIQLYEVAKVHAGWFETLKDEYEDQVRSRLEEARQITATEYEAAQEERVRIVAGFDEAMKDCDVLVAPATPVAAPLLAAEMVEVNGEETLQRTALLSCVTSLSQLGSPVVTVPIGRIAGLPVGLQILGREGSDSMLLAVAKAVEVALA